MVEEMASSELSRAESEVGMAKRFALEKSRCSQGEHSTIYRAKLCVCRIETTSK